MYVLGTRRFDSFCFSFARLHPAEAPNPMYKTCAKRALPCNLGCGLILRAEQWAAEGVRKRHNTVECPKRRVECPRDCGQAVVFDEMDEHLEVLCPKRPVPPLP